MFSSNINSQSMIGDFKTDKLMRYSRFAPRLYNLCLSLGFTAGNIMPSRAFCSDENQGFPIILIAKHFGAFPFNHGRVGGIVATDRHQPHASHGKDMVIIQASHVGYDPQTESFGSYCRLQTTDHDKTTTCGKIGGVIQWYLDEYQFAQNNISLAIQDGIYTVTIDNQLLDTKRTEGLFLNLHKIVASQDDELILKKTLSTSRVYQASAEFIKLLPESLWQKNQCTEIGDKLSAELFTYQRHISGDVEGRSHLEINLINAMPYIVTSATPMLIAAQVNTQVEFDRTYRSIVKEKEFHAKNLLFISCLHIDISPQEGQIFPLTKCIPWAAYIQHSDGRSQTLEQQEIIELLLRQSTENTDQIDLELAIQQMIEAKEVTINID